MFFLVRIDSVQQSNKIDCSLLAMTAFNKRNKPRLDICQILRFHVLNLALYVYFWIKIIADLDSCIWVPGSGSRIPGPRFQNPPVHSRYKSKFEKLYRFVSSLDFL